MNGITNFDVFLQMSKALIGITSKTEDEYVFESIDIYRDLVCYFTIFWNWVREELRVHIKKASVNLFASFFRSQAKRSRERHDTEHILHDQLVFYLIMGRQDVTSSLTLLLSHMTEFVKKYEIGCSQNTFQILSSSIRNGVSPSRPICLQMTWKWESCDSRWDRFIRHWFQEYTESSVAIVNKLHNSQKWKRNY